MSEIVELSDGIQIWHAVVTMIGDPEEQTFHEGNALQWLDDSGDEFRWYWEEGIFLDLDRYGPNYNVPFKRRGSVIYQMFDVPEDGFHGLFHEIGGGTL